MKCGHSYFACSGSRHTGLQSEGALEYLIEAPVAAMHCIALLSW